MIKSARQFVELRTSTERNDYLRAANENAPLKVWMDVIRRHPAMRPWVANNKTVQMTVLNKLAHDSDPAVRMAVAIKNKLNSNLFARLAKDPDSRVRIAIINNRSAPLGILAKLCDDECEVVRRNARSRLAELQHADSESERASLAGAVRK